MTHRTPPLLPLAALVLVACGAPRDPDLEKRALKAQAAAAADRAATPLPDAPTIAPAAAAVLPKSYANDEVRRIMAAVPGQGRALWAEFRTQAGTIKCALDEAAAPQTVANFVGLATGQVPWSDGARSPASQSAFYDGLTFHRVVSNFIIQTGNPGRQVGGGPGWTLPRETGAPTAFDAPGALAMIDAGADSHGSQLFMTTRPDPSLKPRYTAFGRCAEVDVIRTISNGDKVPAADGKSSSVPRDPVRIFSLKVFRAD